MTELQSLTAREADELMVRFAAEWRRVEKLARPSWTAAHRRATRRRRMQRARRVAAWRKRIERQQRLLLRDATWHQQYMMDSGWP
jgi:hypothetical protein